MCGDFTKGYHGEPPVLNPPVRAVAVQFELATRRSDIEPPVAFPKRMGTRGWLSSKGLLSFPKFCSGRKGIGERQGSGQNWVQKNKRWV